MLHSMVQCSNAVDGDDDYDDDDDKEEEKVEEIPATTIGNESSKFSFSQLFTLNHF